MQIKTKDITITGRPSDLKKFFGEEIINLWKKSKADLLPYELETLLHGLASSHMLSQENKKMNPLLAFVLSLSNYIQSQILQGQGIPNGLLNNTFFKISMD